MPVLSVAATSDEVDGRVLFERATARWQALQDGKDSENLPGGLGGIVMVPPVLDTRQSGALNTVGPFEHLTVDGAQWSDESLAWQATAKRLRRRFNRTVRYECLSQYYWTDLDDVREYAT